MFVAADLADEHAAEVVRALASLRARHPHVRWTDADQLHMTMVFLGATPVADVPRLSAAVEQVAGRWQPFNVVMGEGGGVIGRKGSVAWLRVAEGHDLVAELSLQLDRALASSMYARMAPRPHLTVARGVDERALDDLRSVAAGLSLGWTVENVVLFRSHTGGRASRYAELARHRFGGP